MVSESLAIGLIDGPGTVLQLPRHILINIFDLSTTILTILGLELSPVPRPLSYILPHLPYAAKCLLYLARSKSGRNNTKNTSPTTPAGITPLVNA